jgi:hypothetical protein
MIKEKIQAIIFNKNRTDIQSILKSFWASVERMNEGLIIEK